MAQAEREARAAAARGEAARGEARGAVEAAAARLAEAERNLAEARQRQQHGARAQCVARLRRACLGVRGLLCELLTVATPHVAAVNAALGEAAVTVVVVQRSA